MTKLFLVAAGIVIGIPCIWGFAKWERQGKVVRATVLVLVLELVESALYQDQNLIPRGLFHPGSGSTQLRLPEIIITLALLGRLVARRMPQRIGFPAMLWAAVVAWLAVETVEGYLRGNNHAQILYEAKAIIYVVGGFALAAGVPVRDYLEAEVFERVARWLAPLALVIDLLGAGSKSYSVHIPLLPLPDFGIVGADMATMFSAVGLIALMLELGKERRNVWTIVCTVPLIISALLASQRAALLGLGASAIFLILIGLGASARRRLRVRPTEIILAVVVVFAVVLGYIIIPAALAQKAPVVPFVSSINTELYSQGKAESAEDRINELHAAREMIPEHALLGWGLGLQYNYWDPGPNVEVTSGLTEDIYLDLWLRTGLIGLGLFVVAMLVSLGGGLRIWRRHPDRMVAIFAVALVAALIGFLVKGGVESIFEKYRLATIFGLMLGMLRSTVTSAGSALRNEPDLLPGLNVNERV